MARVPIFVALLATLPRIVFLGFVVEDEGPEVGSVVAAVLVSSWTVERAGGGSKSRDPVEDPGFDGATGAAGAAGAGAGAAGVEAKRHS